MRFVVIKTETKEIILLDLDQQSKPREDTVTQIFLEKHLGVNF